MDFQVEMSIDETIKGQPTPFSSPSAIQSGHGLHGEHAEGFGSQYLPNRVPEEDDHRLRVRQPLFSVFPATQLLRAELANRIGRRNYHKVMQRVLEFALHSSSLEEKRAAIRTLNWNEDSSVAPFLKLLWTSRN